MAKYINNINGIRKNKILKYKNKLGLSLITIFSLLLVMLAFNVIKPLTSLFLGVFGLLTFPLIIGVIVFGIMLVLDKEIYLETQDLLFLSLWFVVFVAVIHLATTLNIIQPEFVKYIAKTYSYKVSAGGVIFSLLVFPIYYLTHTVASFVLFSILLVALTIVIIDRFVAMKQLSKLNFGTAKKVDSLTNTLKTQDKYEDEEELIIKNNKPVNSTSFNKNDDDIIISDEEFDKQEHNYSQLNKKDKNQAKIILGLSEDQKEVNKNILQKANTAQDEFNYKQAQESGFNKKEYILTPKIYRNEEPTNNNIDKLEALNKYAENGTRPPKIVHNTTPLNDSVKDTQNNLYAKKELSEADKKNLEYLRATHGRYYETKLGKNSNVNNDNENNILTTSNNTNKVNKPTLIIDDNYLEEEINSDIYDPNLTVKNYQSYANIASTNNVNSNLNNATNINNISTNDNKNNINIDEEDDDQYVYEFRPNTGSVATYTTAKYTNTQTSQTVTKQVRKPTKYIKPTIDLLKIYKNEDSLNEDYTQKAMMLEETLASFKIPAKVISITKGPAFTRFELQMPQGIPVKRVTAYADDISMTLEAQGAVRIETPIPGKNAFGVEVPNDTIATVGLRDIIESYNFESSKSLLSFALGVDITGESKVARLDKMPHLLVAGSTGSGKSVCLNSLIISLLYKASPDDLRIILIDPKRVEFTLYNGLPHLLIPNVITEPDKAISALSWSIEEMERRFNLFAKYRVRNLEEFNATDEVQSGQEEKLPFIVIIVDELADLMTVSKKEIEEKIIRIAQKSRAAGIHLVLATQRPSVDVITGIIKANLPSRIAFSVSSFVDSKTIIDQGGAEKLLGRGDMLYSPVDAPDPIRLQGAFVSNDEVDAVIEFIKQNNEAYFDSDVEDRMFNKKSSYYNADGFNSNEDFDPLMKDVLRIVIKTGKISISKVQRMFGLGFPRAGKIVDQMVKAGFISEPDENKNRSIFITQQEFEERFGEDL